MTKAFNFCVKGHLYRVTVQGELGLGLLVFGTTFNNISVILWRSVLLVEEAVVSGENYRPVASH